MRNQISERGGEQRFAAIVLAAGANPGRPDQLRHYLGRTLVEHAARTALASGASEVVVVVGDHAEEIRRALRFLPVRVVHNVAWTEGIASSIRTGIERLQSDTQAAVVCLCDQPRVTPAHLRALASRVLSEGTPIAASSYEGVLGAPSAFARSVFHRLLALQGSAGARQIIREAGAAVEAICFDEANDEAPIAPPSEQVFEFAETPVRNRTQNSWKARAPPYGDLRPIAV